jgi:hypothetical protein
MDIEKQRKDQVELLLEGKYVETEEMSRVLFLEARRLIS